MAKILVIEDCETTQVLVRAALSHKHELRFVRSGKEAIDASRSDTYILYLIDVQLPDIDGFRLCSLLQETRPERDLNFVFLTGCSDISDKRIGFSLGAEDYIVKPFDAMELRLRIDARVNKLVNHHQSEQVLYKGNLRIHYGIQRVVIVRESTQGEILQTTEEEVPLTPNEFRLLGYLARHEGIVYSREHLLDAAWPEKLNVIDRTVDTHIYNLRRKLGEFSVFLESVHGQGYRFCTTIANR